MTAGCGKFDRSSIKMPEFSFVTTENLHSVAYVDQQYIWVCGRYGTLYYSSDNGVSWQEQNSGVTELLGCIVFINQKQGWTAGVKGTILHTSDSGATWTPQISGVEFNILDLFFLDSDFGWAVGENGMILHTSNGGKSWQQQGESADTFYNDVFFVDRTTGWIAGEFGTLLHTRDGGATWKPQTCADLEATVAKSDWDRPMPALYGIYFIDRDRGWAVGMDGVILQTVNGGIMWRKIISGTEKPLYSIVVGENTGWIVGNKGQCLMSENVGETWSLQDGSIKTRFWLREVVFSNEQHGIIVGARGTIV
ncbi:MAG: hypothetical protein GY868_06730, partial [Deltaproteobacteria bacterium]|nr:hypothetical protein [Deltaproteobacteria bacterium]